MPLDDPCVRKERDLNPRRLAPLWFSRPALSTTQPSFQNTTAACMPKRPMAFQELRTSIIDMIITDDNPLSGTETISVNQGPPSSSSCVATPAYFQFTVDIENERGRIRTYSSKEPDLQSGATLQTSPLSQNTTVQHTPRLERGALTPRAWQHQPTFNSL